MQCTNKSKERLPISRYKFVSAAAVVCPYYKIVRDTVLAKLILAKTKPIAVFPPQLLFPSLLKS